MVDYSGEYVLPVPRDRVWWLLNCHADDTLIHQIRSPGSRSTHGLSIVDGGRCGTYDPGPEEGPFLDLEGDDVAPGPLPVGESWKGRDHGPREIFWRTGYRRRPEGRWSGRSRTSPCSACQDFSKDGSFEGCSTRSTWRTRPSCSAPLPVADQNRARGQSARHHERPFRRSADAVRGRATPRHRAARLDRPRFRRGALRRTPTSFPARGAAVYPMNCRMPATICGRVIPRRLKP